MFVKVVTVYTSESTPYDFEIDELIIGCTIDERKQTPVPIPPLTPKAEDDFFTLKKPLREFGSFCAERLRRSVWVHRLWRVDADEPYRFFLPAVANLYCVAIDDAQNDVTRCFVIAT